MSMEFEAGLSVPTEVLKSGLKATEEPVDKIVYGNSKDRRCEDREKSVRSEGIEWC